MKNLTRKQKALMQQNRSGETKPPIHPAITCPDCGDVYLDTPEVHAERMKTLAKIEKMEAIGEVMGIYNRETDLWLDRETGQWEKV